MKKILLLAFVGLIISINAFSQQYFETFSSGIPGTWSVSDAIKVVVASDAVSGNSIPTGASASGGNNLKFLDCTTLGTNVVILAENIDMSGKTDIKVGLGRRRSNTFSPSITFDYSIDGTNWTSLSNNINPGTGSTWGFINFNLGVDANNQNNIRFRLQYTTTLSSNCTTSSPNFRIDDFMVFYGTNPFPANLTSFTSLKTQSSISLLWSTTSETNFSHFMVQKSKDAKGFESIGRVESVGFESDKSAYSFVDEKPFAGNNYYRLKMVDKDGTEDYSKIISVKFDGTAKAVFYPNPTQDIVNFENIKSEDIRSVTVHKINGEFLGEVLPTDSGLDISAFKSRELILQLNLKNNQILTSRIIKNL
ncbi:MAG: hypothetical protein U0V04_07825 [Spirosomataceae bacterium]|jgi:hypothetical protein